MKKLIFIASIAAFVGVSYFLIGSISKIQANAKDCTVYRSRSEASQNGCREVWKVNGIYYGTKWYTCGDSPYSWTDIQNALQAACMQNKEPEGFERASAN